MAQGLPAELSPPIAATVEEEPILFDFGPLLNANYGTGTYITAVDAINVTAVVNSLSDPTPQSRLLVAGEIVPSQRVPSILNGAVVAWFGTMIGNVTYQLQCIVSLSDGKSHPSIEVRLPCYSPGA